MRIGTHVKTLAALAAATALSGCLGGGGGGGAGGGGGGGGGGGSYQANYDAAMAGKAPTTDMPTTGSAQYRGQTQMTVRDSSAPGAPATVGTLTGDLDMNVAFRPAGVMDPANVTGTASNFVLEAEAGSQTLTGTLTAGAGGLPATVSANASPLGTSGALLIGMGGQLSGTYDGEPVSGDVILNLGGAFLGAGGATATGGAAMLGVEAGGFADITGDGTFYLNRQ